ncbi:MAG: lipase family protein [Bacteroidota bacterium]
MAIAALHRVHPAHLSRYDLGTGRAHVVRLQQDAWRPLITFDRRYTVCNAYNLALMAEVAYLGGEDGQALHRLFSTWYRDPDREAAQRTLSADPILARLRRRDAYHPRDLAFFYDQQTDTEGFGAVCRDHLLIAFRGTELTAELDLDKLRSMDRDVSTDLNVLFRRFGPDGLLVHEGFLLAFQSIQDQLFRFVDQYGGSRPRIILTGHSLGGAMATLAAAFLRTRVTPHVVLVTYGAPRVGNHAFAHYYTYEQPITVHRHVMHQDVVPQLPPGLGPPTHRSQRQGLRAALYTHHGWPIRLEHPPDSAPSSVHGITDHFMASYLEALTAMKKDALARHQRPDQAPRLRTRRDVERERTRRLIEEHQLQLQARRHDDALQRLPKDHEHYHEREAHRRAASELRVQARAKAAERAGLEQELTRYRWAGPSGYPPLVGSSYRRVLEDEWARHQ